MLKRIPFRFAVNTMLFLLSAILVYHFLIVAQLIPYEATWGGRLKTEQEMYRFESVSIILNLAIAFIIAVKGGYIKRIVPGKLITFLLWLIAALFALNTIGNITSINNLEAIIFTPVTLLFAVLCVRIAVE
ncbi:MAG: hypothetical protein R2800_11075 [Flavipsychrobacter sp.]